MGSAPTFETWHHLDGGRNRTALVVHPSGNPQAVWLVFHGVGGTGAWALEESCLAQGARDRDTLLVFPEGRRIDPDKPAGFLQNPQVWDDGAGRFDSFLSPGDDLVYMASLLDRLDQVAPGLPCHWVGFSNGAAFAKRAVAVFSKRAQALSLICGIPFPSPQADPLPQSWPPTLAILGSTDLILPWKGGEVRSIWTGKKETRPDLLPHYLSWAQSLNAHGSLIHDQDQGLERYLLPLDGDSWLELHLVQDMGHHWPGGLGRINRRLAGNPSWRLDGNALLAEFFQRAVAKAPLKINKEASHPARWKPIPSTHPTLLA